MKEGGFVIRYLKILLTGVFFFLLVACNNSASDIEEKYYQEALTKVIEEKFAAYNIEGLSVHISSSKLTTPIDISMGFASKSQDTPVDEYTKFRIGSITKSFTAMAILKLHEDGMVNIENKISEYVNIENEYINNLTVKEIMNMNTGLKCYINSIEDEENSLIVDFLYNNPQNYLTPISLIEEAVNMGYLDSNDFFYSNTNYILLGLVIEEVTGKTYKEYIEEIIIEPLEMSNTYIPIGDEVPGSTALGYQDMDDDEQTEEWTYVNQSYVWSAGNIISTATDISKWMKALIRNNIISKETFDLYSANGLQMMDGVYYTSGLVYDKNNEIIGHNGAVIGYHGDMWYDYKSDTIVVALSNEITDEGDLTAEIKDEIFTILNK